MKYAAITLYFRLLGIGALVMLVYHAVALAITGNENNTSLGVLEALLAIVFWVIVRIREENDPQTEGSNEDGS